MKAVIPSAGLGLRLRPLTASVPKCLIEVGGLTIIDWQLRALGRSGVEEAVVILGHGADAVEAYLPRLARWGVPVRSLFNPFFACSGAFASCWIARDEFADDVLLVNGDILFEPAVAARLVALGQGPAAMAVDHRGLPFHHDAMKVRIAGSRLLEVSKDIPDAEAQGESVGMVLFREEGARAFRKILDAGMRMPGGIDWWWHRAIDLLARCMAVETLWVSGLDWAQIDDEADRFVAEAMVARWAMPADAPCPCARERRDAGTDPISAAERAAAPGC